MRTRLKIWLLGCSLLLIVAAVVFLAWLDNPPAPRYAPGTVLTINPGGLRVRIDRCERAYEVDDFWFRRAWRYEITYLDASANLHMSIDERTLSRVATVAEPAEPAPAVASAPSP